MGLAFDKIPLNGSVTSQIRKRPTTFHGSCGVAGALEDPRIGVNSPQAFLELVSQDAADFRFGTVRETARETVRESCKAVLQRP